MARGKHPNSQANLQPFEKGQSGNPSGRAKAFSGIQDDLKQLVNEIDECYIKPTTHRDVILKAIIEKAEFGDWNAIQLLDKLGCFD